MIRRSWYALLVLWMCLPIATANGSELTNPAEKDFAEFKSETKNTGNLARKNPALNDRSLSASSKANTIRQVSVFDHSADDPFPIVTQPMPPQTSMVQHPSFDWGAVASGVPTHPLLAQNNVMPYDPNAFAGYADPHFGMQDMQGMYLAQQQFAQQQFMQYPQQYAQYQGYAMTGLNPYAEMSVQPQYGYVDPYYQMGGQMDSQNMPNHAAMYQAFLLQEAARRQAEEAQKNEKKEADDAKQQANANWTLNNLMPVRVTSPLGETLLVGVKTISPFSTPTGPDKGVGMPLVNKSWLDHPYYFGGFVGSMSGSELISKMIDQKSGGTGGLTFGYNFNDYWGLESRLQLASIDIYDTDYARQLFELQYQELFPGMLVPPLTTRTNELTILDAAIHYYPLGNAKWRPYFKYGLGVGRQKFINTFGNEQSADIVTMPLGVGVRYWWNERIAIQADLLNNVVFASGIAKTQHNVAFSVGLTYAFGSGKQKHPVHYWPATPSMGSRW